MAHLLINLYISQNDLRDCLKAYTFKIRFRFFVISGYLITSILHKKHRNSDTWIIIKDFYFRRIRRIVPLALIVILISLTVGLLVNSPRRPIQGERITGCLEMCKEAIFASTFTDNLVYLLFGSDFYDIVSQVLS